MSHPQVRHPRELVGRESRTVLRLNDKILTWMTNHVLASRTMFNLAVILPLVTLPLNATVKLLLIVLSSNWIQWWALPALQRQALGAAAVQDAKATADHEALTHIATTADATRRILADLHQEVAGYQHPDSPHRPEDRI